MAARRRRKVTPEVEDVIRDYFGRGFNAKDIQGFLVHHGVNISYSHLRNKVMPDLGLSKRAWNRPDPVTVAEAVREVTADGPGAHASTASVTRALRVNLGMNVVARDVAAAQRVLNPALVAERRTGQLHRRAYHSLGSDFIWHIDGYDKLAPYGLPIHGCVDGFSRYILWLELGYSNRRPEQTCTYFLDAVRTHCLPHTVRTDAGTENKNILQAMRYMSDGLPRLTPLPCVLTGSSNHNERIERFWGLLRQQCIHYWIAYFKDLQEEGQMVAWDNTDRKVSYYVFQGLVRDDLQFMKGMHNDHLICRQPGDIISGKPYALYLGPEKHGLQQCGRAVPPVKLAVVARFLTGTIPFDARYQEILDGLVVGLGLNYPPADMPAADRMYRRLRAETHAMLD